MDRKRAAFALALVLLLGLLSRRIVLGILLWDKSLGDALYAVAVYLALGLIRPVMVPVRLAGVAFAVCAAIEAFQLSGIPARYAGFPPVRWLLGTRFAWHDVACYLAGVALVLCADILWLRARPANIRK